MASGPTNGSRPLTVRLAAPSFRGILRAVLILTALGILLYLTWRVRGVLRLVGISLFLALTLMPVVDAISSKVRAPRALVILGVYVVLIAVVAVIGYVVVPGVVKEVQQVSHDAPTYANDLRQNGTFRHYDDQHHITAKLVSDAHRLPQLLGKLAGPLKDVTVQAFGFVSQLVTVLALAFLLLLHGRRYVNAALTLTGEREEHYRRLIISVNKAVASYMLGNIVISVLATVATWIVLSILGVPYRSRWPSLSGSSISFRLWERRSGPSWWPWPRSRSTSRRRRSCGLRSSSSGSGSRTTWCNRSCTARH
jgi:predicted PurR-regulated permease PerM